MNNARVTRTGTLHDAMAPQTRRMPVAGRVRPGIKVLTRKASANTELVELYRAGIEAGASFDDIEKRLRQVQGCPQYPLAPHNSQTFRVVQNDFVAPGAAARIMELYGERREGDTEPQLYCFPVVFPSDDLDLIFREQFESWKVSQLFRWSEPDPQSGVLRCMHRGEIDQKSKRRLWGGRQIESLGKCIPNACDLFGAGHCKHVGSLSFWIPGIVGVGLIEMTFTSIYASMGIAEMIEMVRDGLGQVKGTYRGKPIFRISKTSQSVARIDWEKGKPERTDQWIIQLSADLDMCAVLGGDGQEALPAPSPAAAALPELEADDATRERQKAMAEKPDTEQSEKQPKSAPAQAQTADTPPDRRAETAELRQVLGLCMKALAWSPDDLTEYLAGNGYTQSDASDPDKLKEILAELHPIAQQRMESDSAEAAKKKTANPKDVPF